MAIGSRSTTGKTSVGIESTFGTKSGSLLFCPTKTLPDTSGLQQVYHDREEVVAGNYRLPGVIGKKSDSTLSLEMWATGWKSTVPTVAPVAADAPPQSMILGNALGARRYAGAATAVPTCQALTTATVLKLSAVTDIEEGDGLVVVYAATGLAECCFVKSITGSDVTLRTALSAVPALNDKVYFGIQHWLAEAPSIGTLSVMVETDILETVTNKYEVATALGCQASSFKMSWTAGEFLTYMVDYAVADWTKIADNAAVPVPGTYSWPDREAILGGKVYYNDGVTSGCFEAGSIELDLGIDLLKPASVCGVQGQAQPLFGVFRPKVTIDPLFFTDQYGQFNTGTSYDLRIQIGTQPGRMIFVGIPAARLVKVPNWADDGGVARQQLEFEAHYYDADDTSGTRQVNSVTAKDASVTVTLA